MKQFKVIKGVIGISELLINTFELVEYTVPEEVKERYRKLWEKEEIEIEVIVEEENAEELLNRLVGRGMVGRIEE